MGGGQGLGREQVRQDYDGGFAVVAENPQHGIAQQSVSKIRCNKAMKGFWY